MPIVKLHVAPVQVARGKLVVYPNDAVKQSKFDMESEDVCINSLSGLILQLASISKHADEIFSELLTESSLISKRTKTISSRIQLVKNRTDTTKFKPLDPAIIQGLSAFGA